MNNFFRPNLLVSQWVRSFLTPKLSPLFQNFRPSGRKPQIMAIFLKNTVIGFGIVNSFGLQTYKWLLVCKSESVYKRKLLYIPYWFTKRYLSLAFSFRIVNIYVSIYKCINMQNLFFVCKYLCIRHLYMYMKVIIKKMAHFIW